MHCTYTLCFGRTRARQLLTGAPLEYPGAASAAARALISGLLRVDPLARIGGGGPAGGPDSENDSERSHDGVRAGGLKIWKVTGSLVTASLVDGGSDAARCDRSRQ